MPTTNIALNKSDGWVQVAADGEEFIIESTNPVHYVMVAMGAAAPAPALRGHRLREDYAFVRAGTAGNAYVRTLSDADVTVVVTV